MCFDTDSLPPIPVISGASISHDELVLTAEDGNRFAAFAATPDEPSATGIVILPDVRGLYRFYEELALRFAERGHAAIAFDYFGRTAGVKKRSDEFEYMPHVQQTTPEGVQADVAACVAWLREHGSTSIFTVGFCFGARNSWLAAASGHALKGAVGFYGNPTVVMEHVERIEAPILALQAGADANITAEMNEAFDHALTVEHEVVTYDGAPHSFFDRKQEEFADASSDAWRRTLDFIAQHA
ncbi:MAG TPA: dienelactone hydrolase family protein [Gaiellaceae bacterium]|nr:dienelactone hydrolase family protein [Gaiellaceae bacterium]